MNNAAAGNALIKALQFLPREDLTAVLKALTEARVELAEVDRDIAKIQANRDVLLRQLEIRREGVQAAMTAIFAERRSVIDAHFRSIDHGMSTNDVQLINNSLAGLSDLVRQSPFLDINQLSALLDKNEVIEI
jgi:hypothetical protein